MRLDARNGHYDWSFQVYDAERCAILRNVVWVDDMTAQSGRRNLVTYELTVKQERKILIYPDRKLVIINPVADDVDAAIDAGEATRAAA